MKACAVEGCTRAYRARGYCGSHYNQILAPDRHVTSIVCAECGKTYITTRTNGQFCSLWCRDAESRRETAARRSAAPLKIPHDFKASSLHLRSPLRMAVEDGDHAGALRAILADSVVTESGCWEWQRVLRDGYPVTVFGRKQQYVHRLALEASMGALLGDQPAHHRCANTRCCNPDHLQPVTHRENVAEMLARNYMVRRIEALEAALALVSPTHHLLAEIGLPKTA